MTAAREAVFVIDGERYYSMLWFMAGPCQDWMAALWRDEGKPFVITYRFRYYASEDPFEKKDRRSVYDITLGDHVTEDKAIESVNVVAERLLAAGFAPIGGRGAGIHKVPVRTRDAGIISSALEAQEWAHIQTEKVAAEPGNAGT